MVGAARSGGIEVRAVHRLPEAGITPAAARITLALRLREVDAAAVTVLRALVVRTLVPSAHRSLLAPRLRAPLHTEGDDAAGGDICIHPPRHRQTTNGPCMPPCRPRNGSCRPSNLQNDEKTTTEASARPMAARITFIGYLATLMTRPCFAPQYTHESSTAIGSAGLWPLAIRTACPPPAGTRQTEFPAVT